MSSVTSSVRLVTDPNDPAIPGFAELLVQTFGDPNICLPAAQIAEFLETPGPERSVHLVVLEMDGQVKGGTFFSCARLTGAGFSEYMILAPEARGGGNSRRLMAVRQSTLDAAARSFGYPGCLGLFIECLDPARAPATVLVDERLTAMDGFERRRYFHHIGFKRVDTPYRQPPLAAGQEPIEYMDLLFLPWVDRVHESLPVSLILQTVRPVYQGWVPDSWVADLQWLEAHWGEAPVPLVPLIPVPEVTAAEHKGGLIHGSEAAQSQGRRPRSPSEYDPARPRGERRPDDRPGAGSDRL